MVHSADHQAMSRAIPVCAPGRRTMARWLLIGALIAAAWVVSAMCGQERAHAATEAVAPGSPQLVSAEGTGTDAATGRTRNAEAPDVVGTVHLLTRKLSEPVSQVTDTVGVPLASGDVVSATSERLETQPTVRIADHLLARVASILPGNDVTSGHGLALARRLPAVVDTAVDTTRLMAHRALAGSTATSAPMRTVCRQSPAGAPHVALGTADDVTVAHCVGRPIPAEMTAVWRLTGRTGHRAIQSRYVRHAHGRSSLICQPLARPCAAGPGAAPAHLPAQSLPSPSFGGLPQVADRSLGGVPPLMAIVPRTPIVPPFARTIVDDRTFSPD